MKGGVVTMVHTLFRISHGILILFGFLFVFISVCARFVVVVFYRLFFIFCWGYSGFCHGEKSGEICALDSAEAASEWKRSFALLTCTATAYHKCPQSSATSSPLQLLHPTPPLSAYCPLPPSPTESWQPQLYLYLLPPLQWPVISWLLYYDGLL